MDNINFVDYEQIDSLMKTFAIIDKGNGEYVSMPKADYDAQIAANQTLPSNFVGIGNAPADPTA